MPGRQGVRGPPAERCLRKPSKGAKGAFPGGIVHAFTQAGQR